MEVPWSGRRRPCQRQHLRDGECRLGYIYIYIYIYAPPGRQVQLG